MFEFNKIIGIALTFAIVSGCLTDRSGFTTQDTENNRSDMGSIRDADQKSDWSQGKDGTSTDNVPPTVNSFLPENEAKKKSLDTEISAVFSEPIDESTLTSTSVKLIAKQSPVETTFSYNKENNTLSIQPKELALYTSYTVVLSSAIADLAGNALHETSWTFQTHDGEWKTPFEITPNAEEDASPSLVGDGNGNFAILWTEKTQGNVKGFCRRYEKEKGWQTQTLMFDDARRYAIRMDSHGFIYVIWTTVNGTDRSDISKRIYKPGTGWSTPTKLEIKADDLGFLIQMNKKTGEGTITWSKHSMPKYVRFVHTTWGVPQSISDANYDAISLSQSPDAIIWRTTNNIIKGIFYEKDAWGAPVELLHDQQPISLPIYVEDQSGNAIVYGTVCDEINDDECEVIVRFREGKTWKAIHNIAQTKRDYETIADVIFLTEDKAMLLFTANLFDINKGGYNGQNDLVAYTYNRKTDTWSEPTYLENRGEEVEIMAFTQRDDKGNIHTSFQQNNKIWTTNYSLIEEKWTAPIEVGESTVKGRLVLVFQGKEGFLLWNIGDNEPIGFSRFRNEKWQPASTLSSSADNALIRGNLLNMKYTGLEVESNGRAFLVTRKDQTKNGNYVRQISVFRFE